MVDKIGLGIAEIVGDKRDDILRLAAQHKAYNVRVFGSVAHGEARPDSDVDLLVTVGEGVSVFDLVGLQEDLKDLLGHEVSLVSDGVSDRDFLDRITPDLVSLDSGAADVYAVPKHKTTMLDRLTWYGETLYEEIERGEQFTASGREAFFAEVKIQYAVEHVFSVIGSTVRKIPLEIRDRYPAVDWHHLINLIGNYDEIDLNEIWSELEKLPELKCAVETMLRDLEKEANESDDPTAE